MSARIEDYALIADTRTAALVRNDGSIDWFCVPRFDSPACFAALLGDQDHGYWSLRPSSADCTSSRRYRGDTLVLQTDYETERGSVSVIDLMAPMSGDMQVTLARIVVGNSGHVRMRTELAIRFGYGQLTPWLRRAGDHLLAVSGPDALRLSTPVELEDRDGRAEAEFTVSAGERVSFLLTWFASHEAPPPNPDPARLISAAEEWWRRWARHCSYQGAWREAVMRSLLTLKALTYGPTGGLVAAPTTSLPEELGGARNWDYRFCWLRDATFALGAMHDAGYSEEPLAWREWLLRTVAGDPTAMQVLYGPAGERHLTEWEAGWLPGYERSSPVRVGNAAASQFQLDIYGEVAHSQHELALERGFRPGQKQVAEQVLDFLAAAWKRPDQGIWETRGEPRHFTYSKVMAWVAFNSAIKVASDAGLRGPIERWRRIRDQIHADVCNHGFDPERNTFVQHYGGRELDASLLRIPVVGFLPTDDPRVRGTIEAVRRELSVDDGLLLRYSPAARGNIDGLDGGEGAFLAASFWLADALALTGRSAEAREQFERLLALRNDVGLLAEEYDATQHRLLGNFPLPLSHLALVNTAQLLESRAPMTRGAIRPLAVPA